MSTATATPTFVSPPIGPRPQGFGALVGAALRRPGGRRALSVLSLVLVVAGVGMFAYPAITDVFARHRQSVLQGQFDDPGFIGAYTKRDVAVGQGLTRLRIPKLKVDVLVVEGTTPSALKAGAGHYAGTPLPGEAGNVAIAGHRTTYGRPFNRLDEMAPGDVVTLETPFAVYTYTAVNPFAGHANPWPVQPTDYGVVGQEGADHWLTLTTCHPKGSARQRLILRLKLTGTAMKPGVKAAPAPGGSAGAGG